MVDITIFLGEVFKIARCGDRSVLIVYILNYMVTFGKFPIKLKVTRISVYFTIYVMMT